MPGVPPARYGYFGPAGTFTHQALLTPPARAGYSGPGGPSPHQALLTLPAQRGEPIPYPTVGQALQAVREGEVTAVLVPIENSVEGGVTATLDNLTYGDPLVITREVLLPVQFTLFGRSGTRLTDVRRVLTHPHAAAQCRDWLARHL